MAEGRFDIVVFNYQRLWSFLNNFSERITGFDPWQDRVTIVTASPSTEEARAIEQFAVTHGITARYLERENRGLAELARVDYFTGRVGSLEANLTAEFVFQMQDHYLDAEAAWSHWGPELQHRVKGDVVPDGIVFDLDVLHAKLTTEHLAGAFADRNHPCWFTHDGRRYIAPNGGNFIVRSTAIRNPGVQAQCERLRRVCDGSYAWAVYAEFVWGLMFFPEGQAFYDIKRDRIFNLWPREQFYVSPDDVAGLFAVYGPGLGPTVRRLARMVLKNG